MKYAVAMICMDGHIVSDDMSFCIDEGIMFCQKCGSPVIHACPHCNSTIPGRMKISAWVMSPSDTVYHLPAYCQKYGKPYPWTQARLDKAAAFIDEQMPELTPDEKADFKDRLPDIMFETSGTVLSSSRIAGYLGRVSSFAQEGFKHNLFGITLEFAKRIIWPPL